MKTPKKFGRKHIEPTICKLPKTELNVCKKSRTDTGNTTKSGWTNSIHVSLNT